jgi:hypothetical protein
MVDATALRQAILDTPLATSSYGEAPEPGSLYIPTSHLKALRLDAQVVIGGRGVGKTFWTTALQSQTLRSTLNADVRELEDVKIQVGFGQRVSSDYPDDGAFSQLLNDTFDSYDIWRAVIMRWVARQNGVPLSHDSWKETITWFRTNPEAASRLMLTPRDWRGLIVFDSLDLTAGSDWARMDDIVRGLLRAILWLRRHPGLFGKVFLREDQAERTVFDFPDASKLLATRAELTWERHDLHGLLWQRLVNSDSAYSPLPRNICGATAISGIWRLPDEMKRETEVQRLAFEQLAGPWMGRDKRRGIPYTWAVGHLADGKGRTSPRSFLAAIFQAAEDSRDRYPNHEYALHYESIKRGIQKASEIRVGEVAEDYPWVQVTLEALQGLNVPTELETIVGRWALTFPDGPRSTSRDRLPPQHADRGWDGVREDLQRLGLIETKKDGRVDMPDLYRVGFGLGRRGGVKPKN